MIACTSCPPSKMAVVGCLPAQYLGRGPGPLYIELATIVEGIESFPSRTPHQLKNTPREAVLPLYCSSSAQSQSTTPHIGLAYYTTTVARTSINLVSLVCSSC